MQECWRISSDSNAVIGKICQKYTNVSCEDRFLVLANSMSCDKTDTISDPEGSRR